MLFNYVFSDSSAKRTTYKFGLIKSILDNLFNSEEEDYSLFISYENLFGKFAENYWNLVTKYHLRQMLPDGKSEYSKIEQIFMALIQEEPAYAFDFMLKYKVEIEKLNYYAWAKFLEKINEEAVVVKLLDKLWNFVLACPSCNIRKSNKIPGMGYVKVIQTRNDALRKQDSAFVQNQFKTYKPQLISDMWKYAQSGGFVVM